MKVHIIYYNLKNQELMNHNDLKKYFVYLDSENNILGR
jgi:hypothetical protein